MKNIRTIASLTLSLSLFLGAMTVEAGDTVVCSQKKPVMLVSGEGSRQSDQDKELDEVLEGFDEGADSTSEADDLEDVLKGFEEESADDPEPIGEKGPDKQDFWDLSGSLSLGTSVSYAHEAPQPGQADYRGITRLRPDLHLELDLRLSEKWKARISGRAFFDFAYIFNGRDGYPDDVLDRYEEEAEFQEVYVQGPVLSSLDIKAGRQIVVWGRSDNIRVTDILNPLDNREPGLVDIEDLRLPVAMTKIDYYTGPWNMSGIAVHEIRFNKHPVPGSEFLPVTTPLPPETEPVNSLDNTEYAFALNGIFPGWDVSLYWARYFDDKAHTEPFLPGRLLRRHSRLTMAGAAANIARGNWLFKSEAAYITGLEFFGLPDIDKSRLDALAGVEYSGIDNTVISLEVANRHIVGFDERLENPIDNEQKDVLQSVLRFSGDYMYDRLHPVILLSMFGLDGEDGSFQRFSVGYDVTDALEVKTGLVTYQSGDRAEFRTIGDNDRFFLEAKYSF
ncbi:MAG: ligand-binding protein SH3 [Deltaproteobacteria bacterium]|nr:ligand-binding protein SH3 [Deltaproteobacteria bacterium]